MAGKSAKALSMYLFLAIAKPPPTHIDKLLTE